MFIGHITVCFDNHSCAPVNIFGDKRRRHPKNGCGNHENQLACAIGTLRFIEFRCVDVRLKWL